MSSNLKPIPNANPGGKRLLAQAQRKGIMMLQDAVPDQIRRLFQLVDKLQKLMDTGGMRDSDTLKCASIIAKLHNDILDRGLGKATQQIEHVAVDNADDIRTKPRAQQIAMLRASVAVLESEEAQARGEAH